MPELGLRKKAITARGNEQNGDKQASESRRWGGANGTINPPIARATSSEAEAIPRRLIGGSSLGRTSTRWMSVAMPLRGSFHLAGVELGPPPQPKIPRKNTLGFVRPRRLRSAGVPSAFASRVVQILVAPVNVRSSQHHFLTISSCAKGHFSLVRLSAL